MTFDFMIIVTVVMSSNKTKDILNLWSLQKYRRKTILKISLNNKRKIYLKCFQNSSS